MTALRYKATRKWGHKK